MTGSTLRRIGWTLGLTAMLTLAVSTPARAQLDVVSDQPGATLLLPYFEVALGTGINTVFSINNASATAILAHVTIWSDLAVPVLAFNVYLTGYDVQTLDLREVLKGRLPRTASVGQDPTDTISPKGLRSQDINFASCSGQLPLPAQLDSATVAHIKASLTGAPSASFGGLCSGRSLGDAHLRGFVTVDTVNACTLRVATDPAYFANDITFQNVLWGDYYYIGPAGGARGDALVHVRAGASPVDPLVTTPGNYTFYGRHVGFNASDKRQPLSTTFATRFLNTKVVDGGLFPGGTSLIVWRDPKVNQGPFTCPATPGVRPAWFPLGQEAIVVFDEQEQVVGSTAFPFPAAAQIVKVDGTGFPVPFDEGWIYLNLNTTVAAAGSVPPTDPAAAQAWVTVAHDAKGRLAVGYRAIQLDSATAANHTNPAP